MLDDVEYRIIERSPDYRFYRNAIVTKLSKGGRGTKTPFGQWGQVSPSPRATGYQWLYLGPRDATKPVRLDEILCEAWHGPRPSGTECLPVDGDRGNAIPDNLKWGLLPENIMDPAIEYREWDYVPGYKCGSDGSIWSAWAIGHDEVTDVWRRLSPTPLKSGHLQVHVKTVDGDRRYGAHHLIATFFYGPCPDGMECCHNDGIPDHNESFNLRWDTPKNNVDDQKAHGVMPLGEDRYWTAKLTEIDVREMRRDHEAGLTSYNRLAVKHGVSVNTIYEAVTRKTWKHVA